MDDNFGVYTYRTVDSQAVCNIYVGGPGNTDEATAQAAAAKLKQDHVSDPTFGVMVAPVHPLP